MTDQRVEAQTAGWVHIALRDMPALAALRDWLETVRADPDIRCVVLSGNAVDDRLAGRPPLLRWLELYSLPTIFAFDGEIHGLAFDVAAACDIRVCSSQASLQVSSPTSARLTRLIGDAVEDIGLPGRVDASTALRCGLVSHVATGETALNYASRLAGTIASRGPIATQLGKEAIWRGLEMPLEPALRFETDLTVLLQSTKDRAEGVRAFLEKRPPKFIGE